MNVYDNLKLISKRQPNSFVKRSSYFVGKVYIFAFVAASMDRIHARMPFKEFSQKKRPLDFVLGKCPSDTALPSSPSDSQISSAAVTHSSSCISLEPPKQGGRHRDFIWLYVNDIGSTKTSGHRKAQ
ncbi:unnamed protein product, partial [Rotaria magnacalcarata]